jgi:hypothetical protein
MFDFHNQKWYRRWVTEPPANLVPQAPLPGHLRYLKINSQMTLTEMRQVQNEKTQWRLHHWQIGTPFEKEK